MIRVAALTLASSLLLAPAALAQRLIIGAEPAEKEGEDKKPDEKKPDEPAKKDDKKKKKKDDKKKDDKAEEKAATPPPSSAKDDVLEETAEERAKREKEKAARDAAEAAAEAEKAKKEEEQRKLVEEKKAADAKKKLENRDQRLAAARKVRQLTRTSGELGLALVIEPGQVEPGKLLEIKVAVARKVDVPDPKYGNLVPIRDAQVVATVSSGKQKARYAVHPLETPGRYGFHTTPAKDGTMQVSIEGKTKDGKSFDATFPVFVGVWPPPDFDDEEKKNLAAAAAASGGRKVIAP